MNAVEQALYGVPAVPDGLEAPFSGPDLSSILNKRFAGPPPPEIKIGRRATGAEEE